MHAGAPDLTGAQSSLSAIDPTAPLSATLTAMPTATPRCHATLPSPPPHATAKPKPKPRPPLTTLSAACSREESGGRAVWRVEEVGERSSSEEEVE